MKIAIINLAYHTNTPTGGDTIAIECAKSWLSMDNEVSIITTESGKKYCISHGFPKENIVVLPFSFVDSLGYEAAIFLKPFYQLPQFLH
jgi:hypothetical protein